VKERGRKREESKVTEPERIGKGKHLKKKIKTKKSVK
jgi:hypothetical protein